MRVPRPTWALLGIFALSWLCCNASNAADILNSVTLENSRQKLQFLRGRKNPTDPVGGIGIKAITTKVGTINKKFNTILSPLFQVELRSSSDPGNFPPLLLPPPVLEFTLLPVDQLELDSPASDTARMVWRDIPVDGGQLLTFELTCRLRATDLKAVWSFDTSVDDGPYFIYSVRSPYLGIKALNGNSTNDWFLTPMTSGQIVPDPLTNGNNHPERDPSEGMVKDAFFTYPGNMMSQFMAYYDPAMGLYMAAEDGTGQVKNLYFNRGAPASSPGKVRVYTYITHFNRARKPGASETQEEIETDLRTYDLGSDSGYPVVTDVFNGDWIDATHIYRDWAEGTNVSFLSRGPLVNRADIDTSIKDTTFILRWGLPLEDDEIDNNAEFLQFQQTINFYDQVRAKYDPLDTIDFEPFVLLGGYHLTPAGPGGGGWDDEAYPLRVGVPELINTLRFTTAPGNIRVKAVAANRDTTGIHIDAPIVTEGLRKGIMRHPDLDPVLAKPIRYRSCVGSEWLRTHRTGLIIQTMLDSKIGGVGGFNAIATTGTGNFAFIEYAPMEDNATVVDRDSHNHTVGGGNYLTTGWLALAAQIKLASAAIGTTPILLGMEHQPETMIEEFILVGRSFAPPLDDTLSGVFRTIDEAVPVPLFTHLYHDYNLNPSKPPSVVSAINAYVDVDYPLEEMLHVRYRYAQLAMHGRMLRSQVAQEDPATLMYVGPINQLVPELRDEHEFFAALATLRGSAIPYLVYGKALRPPFLRPASPLDTVTMPFKLMGTETTQQVTRIVASAWHDQDADQVGIILVNFTPGSGTVRFSFEPEEYGLEPLTNYLIEERIDIDTWVGTGLTVDPTVPYTSPNMTVSPMENVTDTPPWRVFRIVEQ